MLSKITIILLISTLQLINCSELTREVLEASILKDSWRKQENVATHGGIVLPLVLNPYMVGYTSVHPDTFVEYKDKVTVLRLMGNKLTSVPVAALKSLSKLDTLDLSNNPYTSFDLQDLYLPSLKTLNLDSCGFLRFDIELSKHFPNLETLMLSRNQITEVTASALQGLRYLRNIQLTNNKLTSFNPNVLNFLFNLQFVSLAYNQITSLSVDLPMLPQLSSIDFSMNRIAHVSPSLFKFTPMLKSINFFSNQIATVDATFLHSTPFLETVSFYANLISVIPDNFFAIHENLISVNFQFNRLTHLSSTLLAKSKNLAQLDFSHNQITTLVPNQFAANPALTHIKLSNNPFTSFHHSVFNGLTKLNVIETLSLAANVKSTLDCAAFKASTGNSNLTCWF